MVVIIENLSGITAGSPMVGTPIILVQRPINPGLIEDLWIMPLHPKTSEMAKEQEILRTKIIGVTTIGFPAVIPLRFSMITTIRS